MPGPISETYGGPGDEVAIPPRAMFPHLTDAQYGRMVHHLRGSKMPESKTPLKSLFRNDPATPEGKYLVLRRDGSEFQHPSFVLGSPDPIAAVALRAYAREARRIISEEPELAAKLGLTQEFADDVWRESNAWDVYRETNGVGDPGMGRHRIDDPATVARMRKCRSA